MVELCVWYHRGMLGSIALPASLVSQVAPNLVPIYLYWTSRALVRLVLYLLVWFPRAQLQ